MDNEQKTWENWATETFVGPNYYYYKTKWEHHTSDKSFTSWNWVAFFFPYYWMAFRKMYLYAFLIFIGSILGIFIPFAGLALHCLSGAYGNYLYLKKCHSAIKTASQYNNEEAGAYLTKQGKTSIQALILSIVIIISIVAVILLGVIFIGFDSDSTTSTGNTFEITTQNETIEVKAPKYYKCENNTDNEIYLTNSARNSELLFYTYYKKDYADFVNEQHFIDSIVEQLKQDYAISPVNSEKLLTLDHQAPQSLYAFADGIMVNYIYVTCERFDQYYVLSLYNSSVSDWSSTKDEIAEIISSVRPKDSL
jgi:hypothetical protein